MKKDRLKLTGTLPIIVGMFLMLVPLELVFGSEVGNLLDFFGFLLITSGLYLLHAETGGFTRSIITATVCTTATFIMLWCELDHLVALLPKAAFCVLLYLMCTNYAKYAEEAEDYHMSHHFITHMWIDIIATGIELTSHAMGIHGIPSYIFLLIDLYCEAMLMLHMWRFYKKYNGYQLDKAIYASK